MTKKQMLSLLSKVCKLRRAYFGKAYFSIDTLQDDVPSIFIVINSGEGVKTFHMSNHYSVEVNDMILNRITDYLIKTVK